MRRFETPQLSSERPSRGSPRSAWAWACLLLVACSGLLGIQERRLDTSESYPVEGYADCRPADGCSGCLEVHRGPCQVASLCAAAGDAASCLGCVCDNCLEAMTRCQSDVACRAVWQCLQDTRCDLEQGAEASCGVLCGSVLQQHGGLGGGAFAQAVAVRVCAAGGGCLSCLPTEPPPAPECHPDGDCNKCSTCTLECTCTGESFSSCRETCSATLPEECSVEDECRGCTKCTDACSCGGGGFEECIAACQETCTQTAGCDTCADCASRCVCDGGERTDCEQSCEQSGPDECLEGSGSSGSRSCDGCTSCLAACTCGGDAVDSCMQSCGQLACCESGDCGDFASCICGADAETCAQDYAVCSDLQLGCNQCACDRCHSKYALCQETPGCLAALDCMRNAQCDGSGCAASCGDAGALGEAFAAAEATWACARGQGCTCAATPPSVSCSGLDCQPYVEPGFAADACCANPDATAETELVSACGLDLRGHYASAPACTPKNQDFPPNLATEVVCGPVTATKAPFEDLVLQGCCRAADGRCGFWDPKMDLGCMDPDLFEQTTPNCQ